MKIFLFLIGVLLTRSSAYVLLQVRKGDNQSNVDALIHKVLPSGKLEGLVDSARKQFDSNKHKERKRNDKGLESIVVAIDSGASPDDSSAGKADVFDRVIKKWSHLLQEGAMNFIPKYRTELEKFHIKPEIVHFKSGKPSMMFEINTKKIMKSIQDFLSSKEVKHYTDRIANRAAVIYRAFRDEIMND